VVLGAAALMLWPLLWPPDPDASIQLVNGRLIGEATGYVGRVDRDARTVDVSASLVGWRPIVLIINETTSIMVQNRQGGFGDIWKDMPVRVSYELVGDARLARSIEVVTGDAEPSPTAVNGALTRPAAAPPPASPPPVAPPVPAVAPPAASPPAPAARVVEPGPVRPAPAPPAPAAVVAPPPAKPSPAPAAAPPPRRASEPPVAEAPRRPPAPPTPRTESAVPPPARTETDAADGAAAIDWLLKERGR
jgi:hypothetical protein